MIKLTILPSNFGEEPSTTQALGISPERKADLEFLVMKICQKQKGTFLDDFMTIAKECNTNEELVFVTFQYGVTVGANRALAARLTAKN